MKYLESLTIHATTFEPERVAFDSQDVDLDHIDDLELELVGTDFSQADLLADLLDGAQNIRELSLDRFHSLVTKELSIALALATMHQLAHVRLAMVGDGTLDALQHLRSPKRLTLSYHTPYDDPLDEPKTLPPLLKVLASFPNLDALKLWNFTPPHPDDVVALPPLPSVRYLRLSQSSIPALDMVQLCPDLSTLVFSVDREEGDVVASFGPRWHPLRRLMLASPDMAVCVIDRLSTVRLLQVSGTLNIEDTREDGDAVSQFLELLRVASPVSLYASLRVETGGFSAPFWREVRGCAPRLSSLELQLSYSAVRQDGDGDDWLVRSVSSIPISPHGFLLADSHLGQARLLADALKNIHGLFLLKILVPQILPLLTVIIPGMADDDDDGQNTQVRDATKRRELERVRAVAALPRPLVDAIPSLRYLAIADMAANRAVVDDLADGASSGSEKGGGVYEWDEMREVEGIGKQVWWKVVEDDGHRVLREIPEDEGERAQRVIEDGGEEGISQIEGELILPFPVRNRLLTSLNRSSCVVVPLVLVRK